MKKWYRCTMKVALQYAGKREVDEFFEDSAIELPGCEATLVAFKDGTCIASESDYAQDYSSVSPNPPLFWVYVEEFEHPNVINWGINPRKPGHYYGENDS